MQQIVSRTYRHVLAWTAELMSDKLLNIALKVTAAVALFIIVVGWLLPLAILYAFLARAWLALQFGI